MKISSINAVNNRQNFGVKFSPRYEAFVREGISVAIDANERYYQNKFFKNCKNLANKLNDATITIKKSIKKGIEQYKFVLVFDNKAEKDMVLETLSDFEVKLFKIGMKKMRVQKKLDKIFARK